MIAQNVISLKKLTRQIKITTEALSSAQVLCLKRIWEFSKYNEWLWNWQNSWRSQEGETNLDVGKNNSAKRLVNFPHVNILLLQSSLL